MISKILIAAIFVSSSAAVAGPVVVNAGDTVSVIVQNCAKGAYSAASVTEVSASQVNVTTTCKPFYCLLQKQGEVPFNLFGNTWKIYKSKEKSYAIPGKSSLVANNIDGKDNALRLIQSYLASGVCYDSAELPSDEVPL